MMVQDKGLESAGGSPQFAATWSSLTGGATEQSWMHPLFSGAGSLKG